MEQYPNHKINYSVAFIKMALLFLLSALSFGLLAALQYIIPGFGRDTFSFEKLRPLHVSSAVFWIILGAMGSVISFFRQHKRRKLKNQFWIKVQFYIFTLSFGGALVSYCFGIFSGREYWEFHPLLAIPIAIGWIVFIVNFLSNLGTLKNQPVFIWMWFTGILFFLFTYVESNLWLIPAINDNLVKDMTIQWKSYGSMVGSWNLLIYGSSIFLMDAISGSKKYSYSNLAFALYFLSLFNLMFNWGHHIYTLPTSLYIKDIGYLVSMTELFLFGRIIYLWRSSVTTAQKYFHIRPYRFLLAADVWVFLTLGLAVCMSIPALNIYMHGTHVIVAHTMGATIGINSFLLIAFACYILGKKKNGNFFKSKWIDIGFWVINISLVFFWISLIVAGFIKSHWMFHQPDVPFGVMMMSLKPWFISFYISGCGLFIGFCMIIFPLLFNHLLRDENNSFFKRKENHNLKEMVLD